MKRSIIRLILLYFFVLHIPCQGWNDRGLRNDNMSWNAANIRSEFIEINGEYNILKQGYADKNNINSKQESIGKGENVINMAFKNSNKGSAGENAGRVVSENSIKESGFGEEDTVKHYKIRNSVVKAKGDKTIQLYKKLSREHSMIAGSTLLEVLNPGRQRLETLKDALKFQPGVMVQEFFGANDQPRLNIRGSGIQSNPQNRGAYLLQDGIPINFADGSYIIGLMDPMTAKVLEVFKGANALKFGAATLGGAINFISRRGNINPGFYSKAETGSFGYRSIALMGGNWWGKHDFYICLSAGTQVGARKQNSNQRLQLNCNWGYKIGERYENRLYFTYSYLYFDIPGPLNLAQIKQNPRQINKGILLPLYMGPDIERDKPSREIKLIRIADKFTYKISEKSHLETALYYQYADDRFVLPIVISTQRSYYNDCGLTSFWVGNYGRHRLQAGIILSAGQILREGRINKFGLDSYAFSLNRLIARNICLLIQDRIVISPRLMASLSLQGIYNVRNSKDIFPYPGLRPWYSHTSHKYRFFFSKNISLSQSFTALNPRIGLIYNPLDKGRWQVYTNISKSYEPPTFDQLIGTKVSFNINTSPKQLFAVKLKKQEAWTIELGTRMNLPRLKFDIAFYNSFLHNEILEVKDFVLGIKTTKNYPYTRHLGVEMGFQIVALKNILSSEYHDKLIFRGVYNYSDFRFTSGKYRGNRLAGLPVHYLITALNYSFPFRFNMGINAEWQPKPTFVDHQNTLSQPPYMLLGARINFNIGSHLSFYIEGKNLLDAHYASSYIINDQIHAPPIPFLNFGAKQMCFFVPGMPRSFYLGLNYKI